MSMILMLDYYVTHTFDLIIQYAKELYMYHFCYIRHEWLYFVY